VAKGIGASVDRVGQDIVDRVVERQPPGDTAPSPRVVPRTGKAISSEPKRECARKIMSCPGNAAWRSEAPTGSISSSAA
jgi:hypothetical protein